MTKRARSPSPRTARTSAHPLRLLATLPPLDTRPAGIAEPADPPAGAERAHCAVSASLHFSPAPPAGGLAEGCAATVYAAENALVLWDAANARGLSVPYEKIAIHAIARASETEKGCVYIQLLGADMVDAEGNAVAAPTGDAPDEGDSDEKDPRYDDDEDEMLEIRLVPEKEEDRGFTARFELL